MSEDCQKEDHNYVYPNPGWGVTIYGYKPENCPYCEIDRLTAELSRYKQGVEVEGNYIWWEQCIANVSLDKDKFRGKKVKAFVIPIEESCDE